MHYDRIRKLPRRAWTVAVKPPRFDHGRSNRAVFGFDTEYDSKSGKLLSVQLWRPGFEVYKVTDGGFKLTYDSLRALIPGFKSPFLVAFFSLADISKIAEYWQAKLTETGLGMLMANYADMTIFDIATFWSSDRSLSLAKLGKIVGCEKIEWDTSAVNRKTLDEPGFKAYAMRDAEICYKAYDEFIRPAVWRNFNIDALHYRSSPTISSVVFRRRLKSEITPPPRSVRALGLLCYWGGRSEVYRVGEIDAPITEIDANSEYPRSAIALGKFPDGADWKVGGHWQDYRAGFVQCLFSYPENWAGFYALPVFYEGRLYWPPSGESYCTIAEIAVAKKYCPGLQIRTRAVAGYIRGTRSELTEYLKLLLAEKDKATGADRYTYKLLANSLIGKLAQNKSVQNDAKHIQFAADMGVPPDFIKRRGASRIEIGNCYWPEAAALILGKARAVLYEAMETVGAENVILCSTDSIVYEGTPNEFSVDGVPFELQTTGDRCVVWREKVYCISKGGQIVKVAHHALPRRAVIADGKILIDGKSKSITVETREFVKLPGAARGDEFGSVKHKTKIVSLTPSKDTLRI